MARKISNIEKKQGELSQDLQKKLAITSDNDIKSKNIFQKFNGIYDSGWLEGITDDEALTYIVTNNFNNNEISFTSYGDMDNASPVENVKLPVTYAYNTKYDLNLSEDLLPFLKAKIFIKNNDSEVEVCPQESYYGNPQIFESQYYEILGDTTTIYKGSHPPNEEYEMYTEEEFNNGDITFTSKWYQCDIEYQLGANTYRIEEGYVRNAITAYDVESRGGSRYDYKTFNCSAIDFLSTSSITGKGIYTEVTWEEVTPGNWESTTTITRNVQMTAPLFDDSVLISIIDGTKYLNGEYNSHNTLTGINFEETIELSGVILVSSLNEWDIFTDIKYRLWESDKRVTNPYIGSSVIPRLSGTTIYDTLLNLGNVSSYQGSVFPYSNYYLQINQGTHPDIIENTDYPDNSYSPDYRLFFYNLDPVFFKKPNNIYQVILDGRFPTLQLAQHPVVTHFYELNETYSVYSGSHYELDALDRGYTKEKTVYVPVPKPIQFKVVLYLLDNKLYTDTRS